MKISEVNKHPKKYISGSDSVVNLVETSCSDALKFYKTAKAVLWHGMKPFEKSADKVYFKELPDVFVSESRNNRPPRNSTVEIQNLVDEKLIAAGFEALRRNSLFVTSDVHTAFSYGSHYAIFPFDGFKFTWSETMHDLFGYFMLSGNNIGKNDRLTISKLSNVTPKAFIAAYRFKNKDFLEAIKSEHEIYLKGKYVAIKFNRIDILDRLMYNSK